MSSKIVNIDHSSNANGSQKVAEAIKLQTTDYSPQIKYVVERLNDISDNLFDLKDTEAMQRLEESINSVSLAITESSSELIDAVAALIKAVSDLKLKFEFKNENPEIKMEVQPVSPQISIKIPPFLIVLAGLFGAYFAIVLSYLVFHK